MDARKKGMGLAAVGLLFLLTSAFTNSWMTAQMSEEVRFNVGLRKAQACVEGKCGTESLSALFGDKLGAYRTAGLITFVLILLACVSLVLSLIAAAQNRTHLGPFAPSSAVLVLSSLALVVSFYALLKFFGDTKGALGLGWSFYVFAMGVFAAGASAIFQGRAAKEADGNDGFWE